MRQIDADELLKKAVPIHGMFSTMVSSWDIVHAPIISPDSLRPKGRWILKDDCGNGVCSCCNRQDEIDHLAICCRYCGADMREEKT